MRLLTAIAVSLLLAGCSGSGGSAFTTSSVTPPPAPGVVNDPATRVAQAAWTSARAGKCGFEVDQAKLKAGYIAYETAQGTAPEALAKLDRAFEASRSVLVKKIANQPDYCSTRVVEETRGDLARNLAGDYAARAVAKADLG